MCAGGTDHHFFSYLSLNGTHSIYRRPNSPGEGKVNGPWSKTHHLKNDFFLMQALHYGGGYLFV